MRKKTIKCLCNEIIWGIMWLLPLILLALVTFQTGQFVSISTAMEVSGFGVLSNNFLFNSLNSVFGVNGVVPMFSADILSYFTYFVSISLLHLFVDILLWIPRYAHHLLGEVSE